MKNINKAPQNEEEEDDRDDWVDDVPTSPKDHGIFHVGDDWEFSPGFWD